MQFKYSNFVSCPNSQSVVKWGHCHLYVKWFFLIRNFRQGLVIYLLPNLDIKLIHRLREISTS